MEFKLTGGARIGRMNASFPFASLFVNEDKIELNAGLMGKLIFQPSDIVSVEPYVKIPFLGQGVKINHTVSNYKKHVVFWTLQSPEKVIRQIKETGFLDKIGSRELVPDPDITALQNQGGFPVKKSFAIGLGIVWNLLIIADVLSYTNNEGREFPFGPGILAAFGLVFLAGLMSLLSPDFRKLILKEGRGLEDIKGTAFFVMLVSGITSTIFLLVIKQGVS